MASLRGANFDVITIDGESLESILATKIAADSSNVLTNKSMSYSQISNPPDLSLFITADSTDT